MINRKGNVFEGPTAVKDFLHPQNAQPLPLVELPGALNPFQEKRVRIFAKLMYMLPMLNIKSLPALNMLLEADSAGRLDGVSTIV
jgi:cysteine synthase